MPDKKPQYKTGVNKSKIIIVDDHPIVRQGLIGLIITKTTSMFVGKLKTPIKRWKQSRR